MSYSYAQKALLKEANESPSARTYLADHCYTVQQANGWWRSCDALQRRGIFKKVHGLEAFQIAPECTASDLRNGARSSEKAS